MVFHGLTSFTRGGDTTWLHRLEIGLLGAVSLAALPLLAMGLYQFVLLAAFLVSAVELPRTGGMEVVVYMVGMSAAGAAGFADLWMATLRSPDAWSRRRLGGRQLLRLASVFR